MATIELTKQQARRFLLLRHGLYGIKRFEKKAGVLEVFDMLQSIQYDPIDVCGRNADLVLQSRVKHYRKKWLDQLLYKDRLLVDYYDKVLCILPVQDWPYFGSVRARYRKHARSAELLRQIAPEVKSLISKQGPLSSKDLPYQDKIDWYWNATKRSRAVLEYLYKMRAGEPTVLTVG
ncbi:MAG: winged helix DNA-binding domain-containing protein [Erysipelotrichaceae bacterium]|jgi:uncharacterized protein YcaQ|nr:winged helix DNA-binding domain-containing protein [Erysipelotrichaceae bacterium]